ncbi:hypothetical protein [Enterococcus sp. AZ196]|uniref:hypothetical protein n=1 Tax=Enterococcus sp. AZ196 TaxID=2774659 RepID=UPI003D2BE31E
MLVLWAVVGFMTLCLLIYLMVKDGRKDEGNSWAQKIITGLSGRKYNLFLPKQWEISEPTYVSNTSYDFMVENANGTAYIGCIVEDKRDFVSLDVYKEITERSLWEDEQKEIYFESVERSNERFWEVDYTTTFGGMNHHILYQVKESETQYVQLVAWTSISRFDDLKPPLETIMNSFSEVTPLSLKNTEKEQ